eukprot:8653125-Pyramimonas_sp.AAC.1
MENGEARRTRAAPGHNGTLATAAGAAAATNSPTAMPWVAARTYEMRPSRPAWARVNWPWPISAKLSRPLRVRPEHGAA